MAVSPDRGKAIPDASHLYEVALRDRHLEREGFRISELELTPEQTVPWHSHTEVSDTFYVLEGEMRLFVQEPKEDMVLKPGDSFAVAPGRPHLVTNVGQGNLTFLVLQGVGTYDYVPLV